MLTARALKFIIDKFYWTSPYRWVDEWQKHLEQKAKQSGKDWEKIRQRRYLIAELYFVGWFGLAVLCLVLYQWLPVALAYILMLRVLGTLNKELGVVLFGICKITEGRRVSSSSRVITNALINYLTAGLLFAFLYSKSGTYEINSTTTVSPLPIQYAIVEGLSVHFTLTPAYAPGDPQTWLFIVGQSIFCFLFGTIIISLFVSLLNLKPKPED
jgi:hypothetical protein